MLLKWNTGGNVSLRREMNEVGSARSLFTPLAEYMLSALWSVKKAKEPVGPRIYRFWNAFIHHHRFSTQERVFSHCKCWPWFISKHYDWVCACIISRRWTVLTRRPLMYWFFSQTFIQYSTSLLCAQACWLKLTLCLYQCGFFFVPLLVWGVPNQCKLSFSSQEPPSGMKGIKQ